VGRLTEMKLQLRFGESTVQCVEHDGGERAVEKAVGKRLVHCALEKPLRPNEYVLHAHGVIVREHLTSPLVQRILFYAEQVVPFCLEHPLDDAIINGHADKFTENLAEEDGAGGNVHVVSDLLVLQHVLGAVPDVACNRSIGIGASWMSVSVCSVYHEPVEKFVEGADWKLEGREGVKPRQGDDHDSCSQKANDEGPNGNEKEAAGENSNDGDE